MHLKSRNVWSLVALAALLAGSLPLGRASAQVGSPLPTHAPMPTPVPSPILPIVPTVAPGYQAPMVIPTQRHHRRRHAAAVRWPVAAGCDWNGAAQKSEPLDFGVELASRGLSSRRSKGRVRSEAAGTAGVEHADFTLR